jgi:CDP-diacylglycerol--serine O-phosphatidyltransferase
MEISQTAISAPDGVSQGVSAGPELVAETEDEARRWSLHHEFTIANFITTASLLTGVAALLLATHGSASMSSSRLRLIVGLVCLAAFLDAIDGPLARYTHTAGAFGCNLDSLADIVAFGVTPAVALYVAQLHRIPIAGLVASAAFCTCAAWRLARFPLCQSSHGFVGCPVPLGAVVVCVLATAAASPAVTFAAIAILSYLMVGTLRFPTWSRLLCSLRRSINGQ